MQETIDWTERLQNLSQAELFDVIAFCDYKSQFRVERTDEIVQIGNSAADLWWQKYPGRPLDSEKKFHRAVELCGAGITDISQLLK